MPTVRSDSQIITRPADTTAYASGDLVANNTAAGSVTPFVFSLVGPTQKGNIRAAALFASQNLLANGSFRLHLFTAAPTVANGDNGALAVATNIAAYLGFVDVVLAATGAGGAMGWTTVPDPGMPFVTGSTGQLWVLVEARAAYAPASAQTFQLSVMFDN